MVEELFIQISLFKENNDVPMAQIIDIRIRLLCSQLP